jgi:hypothetical protein
VRHHSQDHSGDPRIIQAGRKKQAVLAKQRRRASRKRASGKVRALRRRDDIRRSAGNLSTTDKSKPGNPVLPCVDLLIEALHELTDLLVEERQCRHGRARRLAQSNGLGTVATAYFLSRLCRTGGADIDAVIKNAMADVAHRLASKLDYQQLHSTLESIAGNPDNPSWGQRFTPLASCLNGAITKDGSTWCT